MDFKDWSSRRVQVGPVNLHYRTAGTGPVVVLLHGFLQHSLMWHAIGPILTERFTVIALDQRGVGMSSITADGYDGTTMAGDLKGLLDAIGVEKAYVTGYDLGTRTAAAFARDYPERVERVAFIEFALPSFGYEQNMAPTKDWSLNSNWHLSLFTVPDAAEFLIRGKEREMLPWWFYHIAYSGNVRISAEHSRPTLARSQSPARCGPASTTMPRCGRMPRNSQSSSEAADHARPGLGRRGVDRAVCRCCLDARRR